VTAELPYPAMITHQVVIGYPHDGKRSLVFRAAFTGQVGAHARPSPSHNKNSGERHQVGEVLAPRILYPIGQQDHPLGLECLDRALVVSHQDNCSLVAAEC
jgi:hypothetical protein